MAGERPSREAGRAAGNAEGGAGGSAPGKASTAKASTAKGAASLDEAAARLRAGGAAIFPTDTVYGLGVAVFHAPSPAALFELKGRPAGKPVAWLVGEAGDLTRFGADVPPYARRLAEDFWPGALTLVVRASEAVPAAFVSAEGTVGLRMPASPEARALVRAAGPLATTSANLSGAPSAERFEDVDARLARAVGCAVRTDAPLTGVASTVVDCTRPAPRVLRQGGVVLGRRQET